ncbi:MAG: type I glutamate--ammonia ligase [Firmicutes bacterium HGW-Firmicutes-5]|nr:MAG: type I glutamate--ammonia ligase [Firmicutes bacterium HGW-Firmicutes-5]
MRLFLIKLKPRRRYLVEGKKYTKADIQRIVADEDIKFIRLQFVDILGALKNVAITVDQLDKALNGEIMFDGSSISGFVRMEESDMYLIPDLDTFVSFPWRTHQSKVARLICDIYKTTGEPYGDDPRGVLKHVIAEAETLGYAFDVRPEFEFFLFQTDENGDPTTITHDKAGYFDLGPMDLGENVRRDMVLTLEEMGFKIRASHHEDAPGQHEIDFESADAITMADQIVTFKLVVKVVAQKHGLHATFMPKPLSHINGSGMHINMKLKDQNGKNIFYDAQDPLKLSQTAYYFLGGLLAHSKAITAITNPTVNSYKRLVPGFEAPVHIGWSTSNLSPLVRIPTVRGEEALLELRSPDPSCNPYLGLSVILKAGLDGINNKIMPPEMMNSDQLRAISNILSEDTLPSDLKEAIIELSKDQVIKEALGNVYDSYIKAKGYEWDAYQKQVHAWEVDTYTSRY